ncbi:MAG: glucosyl-3-phosphoglycerate synthase [Chloroflexota bacterium]
MTENSSIRVMLVVTDTPQLGAWTQLARDLAQPGGEVFLRGIVTVPEGNTLSEGVTQAQQMRGAIRDLALDYDSTDKRVKVQVEYRPILSVFEEIQELGISLLLVQWAGPFNRTGGVTTNSILQHAPCDVVLIFREEKLWDSHDSVLLSLRGGPNLSLGVKVATALANGAPVTLFHAADRSNVTPNLQMLGKIYPNITRTVTAVSDITEGVVKESAGHKAVIMGASFQDAAAGASGAPGQALQQIYERTDKPLVLVRAWQTEALEFHAPLPPRRSREDPSTRVDRWFAENTFDSAEFDDLHALLALKERQGVTISVGLPALNEEATVGKVISTIKKALMDDVPLIDEIVLIDSDSTDRTVEIAESLGIPAYRHSQILPELGSNRGKGEALWKSLHVLKGDIVAWIDTDITNIHPRFIYGLLGPLLKQPKIVYVKGFYQRPIKVGDQLQAYGGGRVTELVARPLLNLFYPELSGIIQPLSGEYAGRRTALEQVPFFSGYGVETGLMLDLNDRFGLDAIAQTDLEERVHHNQPLIGLSKMSFAILQVFISRLETRYGVHLLDWANRTMKIVHHQPERFALEVVDIADVERPPMITIPAYVERKPLV